MALTLGISLVVLSVSVLLLRALSLTVELNHREQRVLASAFTVAAFYGLKTSATLRAGIAWIGLLYVVGFPVVVGYVGFRALVIKGVYFDA